MPGTHLSPAGSAPVKGGWGPVKNTRTDKVEQAVTVLAGKGGCVGGGVRGSSKCGGGSEPTCNTL